MQSTDLSQGRVTVITFLFFTVLATMSVIGAAGILGIAYLIIRGLLAALSVRAAIVADVKTAISAGTSTSVKPAVMPWNHPNAGVRFLFAIVSFAAAMVFLAVIH